MDTQALRLMLVALYEPEATMVKSDVFGTAAKYFRQASSSYERFAKLLSESIDAEFQKDDGQELLVDHVRLFLSPTGAAANPYLSAWTSELGEDIVQEYLEFINRHGIEPAEDYPDLPEHAAMLFDILALLSDNKPVQREYFHRFVEPWGMKFSQAITTQAQTSFYKTFGRFLGEWLLNMSKTIDAEGSLKRKVC